MNKIIVLLVLILSACGSMTVNKGCRIVQDEELMPYVERFESIYGQRIEVSIYFKDLKDNQAGLCTKWSDGHREVKIDLIYWLYWNDEQKEQLIFHELGHCILNKGHDNDTLTNGCPASIMRDYMFNLQEIYDCYIPYYDYYIDDLFY